MGVWGEWKGEVGGRVRWVGREGEVGGKGR